MAAKRWAPKLLKPKRPRNPLVPVVRSLRPKQVPAKTRYKRRPKHLNRLSEE